MQCRRDGRWKTDTVAVVISGDVGTSVTVPAGGSENLHITDTYLSVSGSLVVSKNSIGPAAGNQGQVTITVTCGGTSLPNFVVPAGATGYHTQVYNDIPAGSTCIPTRPWTGRPPPSR